MPAPSRLPAWLRSPLFLAIVTAIAVALFVSAGNWQRGRLAQKEGMAAAWDRAQSMPAVPLPGGTVQWSDWLYRKVELRGTWLPEAQLLLDNRIRAGRTGFHVLTPMRLADSRVVMVNRGFVAALPRRDQLPAVAVPGGEQVVEGRVAMPPQRYLELGSGGAQGAVWQNLDTARMSHALGVSLLPIVVEAIGGPADGLARDWPRPDFGADTHRIYMGQWYAFAALAVILFAYFTLRRRVRR